MDCLRLDVSDIRARMDSRNESMSVWRKTSAIVIARHLKAYKAGDRVKILRGTYADQVMTVADSANDWVTLQEVMKKDPSRYAMSKGNVEPAEGFTRDEMNQAERVSRRGGTIE